MLKGWVDLTSSKPHVVKKSIKYLEQGTQDIKDVLGLMGKVGGGGRGREWGVPGLVADGRGLPSELRPDLRSRPKEGQPASSGSQ